MKTNMNMMKSILMVLVVGALVCSSCDDGSPLETFANGSGTQPCNCFTAFGSTAHLAIDEACKCGGTECNCTEQTATVSGTAIPIRKSVNVSVKQMNDVVDNLGTEYSYFNQTEKAKFSAKVNKIYITSGSNINLDEAGILNIGCDTDIGVIMDYIFDNIM